MKFIFKIIRDFPAYIWSGWGAMSSIFLFIALWNVGNQVFGSLVLPSPIESFVTLYQMAQEPQIWIDTKLTVIRAFWGFTISVVVGSVLGLLSGFFVTTSLMTRPIITMLVGMPPIVWIVMAMIWFGMGGQTVIFTVVISSFPIVFMGALQGTRTLDNEIKEMADSFHLPLWIKMLDVYFPHIFSYLFPAWIAALGMIWKIVVMAELLTTNDGLGANLAIARSQLDTPTAMALVVILIGMLLIFEYVFLEPVRREVESWRN